MSSRRKNRARHNKASPTFLHEGFFRTLIADGSFWPESEEMGALADLERQIAYRREGFAGRAMIAVKINNDSLYRTES